MREIDVKIITDNIEKMCIDANCCLNADIYGRLQKCAGCEKSAVGKDILEQCIKNADLAKQKKKPICQDTGMAVIFMEIGQEVHFVGGSLTDAVNEGVRRGYVNGYLRKSIVSDPLLRVNTRDNTPAVIHYDIVEGDKVKIDLAPKGFGSENMSRVYMLKPSDGIEGVKNAVIGWTQSLSPYGGRCRNRRKF